MGFFKIFKPIVLPLKRRRDIFRLLRAVRKPDVKIVVGASDIFDKGWVPTDMEFLNLLKEGDWKNYFKPDTISAILAEHVWEHLTPEQGELAASHCFKYLKPGGHLRIAIPDGNHPKPEYIEHVRIGGSGPGAHDHKVLYTYKTLSAMLERVGFKVRLLEYFDENGQFHEAAWKSEEGHIRRSKNNDKRNAGGELNYTSLIADAIKP
ncbi:class I SAM-dependent methyltransferase [Mucilaginibacter sp. AW1-3]